uniref:Movement protein n=1 Tax=Carnation mottle virus TaxID=11986 RepID=G0YKY7_CARMV|nr:movement protein [Carnation mottle virus]
MPSVNLHLIVLTGVIGLMLLIRLRCTFTSTFSLPPLVTLNQIIALSFCGLLLNSISRAERACYYNHSVDSSKQQHISISTPNGK